MMKPEIQKKIETDRRCFLSNCVKLSIGASLVGLSMNSSGNVNDSYLDYGYCIYRCPVPCNYNPSCGGCRVNDSLTCTTRVCVVGKGLLSCAHCTDLATCTKDLWVNYPGQKQFALNKQKQWGLLTSISELELKKEVFNVFPTITDTGFTISNTNQTAISYCLIDIKGQTLTTGVFDSKKHFVDISNLHNGTYILNIIKDNDLLYMSKIIKK